MALAASIASHSSHGPITTLFARYRCCSRRDFGRPSKHDGMEWRSQMDFVRMHWPRRDSSSAYRWLRPAACMNWFHRIRSDEFDAKPSVETPFPSGPHTGQCEIHESFRQNIVSAHFRWTATVWHCIRCRRVRVTPCGVDSRCRASSACWWRRSIIIDAYRCSQPALFRLAFWSTSRRKQYRLLKALLHTLHFR